MNAKTLLRGRSGVSEMVPQAVANYLMIHIELHSIFNTIRPRFFSLNTSMLYPGATHLIIYDN